MTITGLDILQSAEKYKGVPYYEGNPQGIPPAAKGMDCSGLVQRAMADLGMSIPRTTETQLADAVAKGKVIGTSLSAAQQGDILHYVGHEEIWIGNGNVFSESIPGEVADTRARTPWPIIGIVRYADGGAGPIGGLITHAPTQTQNPIAGPVISILNSLGVISAVNFVASLVKFFTAIADPGFWKRVAMGFLGAVLLALGIYGIAHKGPVIQVTSDMVKKGVSVAS